MEKGWLSNINKIQEGFKELQKWLEYFDAFWGSKLKKLGNLLNDKTIKK